MRRRLLIALAPFSLTLLLLAASLPVAEHPVAEHQVQSERRVQRSSQARAHARQFDDGVIDSGLEAHLAHQHGGEGGHLPPTTFNVELVSKLKVSGAAPGRVADVGLFGNYAYLGAFAQPNCERGGVYVIDISDVRSPREVGFIPTGENSFVGEGVHVTHLDTPAFAGDVLAFNNEICGDVTPTTVGGLTLVDVTNPTAPVILASGVGDFDPRSRTGAANIAHQIHSAFLWDAGDKAYAVLVDDEEKRDVDIMDITDPRKPVLVAEYDLSERFPQIIQEQLPGRAFLHDMTVKRVAGRWIMLLSYWDGGYVLADVTDPRNLSYLGDSDFTIPDPQLLEATRARELPEGNAHQAEFSRDNEFIVAADEDFAPFGLRGTNLTDGRKFAANQASDSPLIKPGRPLEGETVFVGLACPGAAIPAGNGSHIAVVERGVCSFAEKAAAVEAAGGYIGVIVFNREGPDGCSTLGGITARANIPVLFVGRDVGFGFFNLPYDEAACRAGSAQAPIAIGARGDRVRLEGFFNGWGYVHLYRRQSGKLVELDTYAIDEAHDPAFAEGFGALSVHEVAMSQRRDHVAYFAYYAGGFRVARIAGDKLLETGRFIDEGGNDFWGVEVFQRGGDEYVAASDRNFGLYIFRYPGVTRPRR